MKLPDACQCFDEPEFWLHFHGWTTVLWWLQFPLVYGIVQDLQRSVPYLVGISIAAAALGQMSSWQAVRVELKLKRIEIEKKGVI